ncbi:CPBP family intramembrane glutamic endopeptidase [Paenibacillus dakarensis]|uniref:CPBP family intramembrane glutamic endopeptidase n=1 Tax=Paenibacillus dakarensis TaxID=1527293 RepID=UPI0006D56A5D|nr:CPBP family intramembrane glutamic endopeptidase [Paenibacillus dakarensis]
MNSGIRNIIVFVSIVIVSGWIGVLVDSLLTEQPKGDSLGMGIWLILPMLTAFTLLLLSKAGWKEVGIKPNFIKNFKWYLISVFIFPVVTGITLIIGDIAKWIDLSELNLKIFMGVFFSTLLVGFIKNIFEETVWRGFLTSQLVKLNLTDWKIYLIVGLVWGIWHVPYYMVFLPETDMLMVMPVSRFIFIVVAILTMLCWSIMYIELFRITKSIWPCVLLHTVEDSLINPLVISGFISISPGKEILISPISGVITSLLYLGVGLILRASRLR